MKNVYLRLICSLFFFFSFLLSALSQLEELPTPQGAQFENEMYIHDGKVYSMFSKEPNLLFAYTEDLVNWELAAEIETPINYFSLEHFLFEDGRFYFFVSDFPDTSLIYFSDDGINWGQAETPSANSFYFEVSGDYWVMTSDLKVYISNDEGQSWIEVLELNDFPKDVKSVSSNEIWILTKDRIYQSFDNGLSWDDADPPYPNPTTGNPGLAIFPTESEVFIVQSFSGTPAFYRTSDWGTTWDTLTTDIPYTEIIIHDIKYLDNQLWLSSSEGFAVSDDLGESWQFKLTQEGSKYLLSINDTLLCGGSSGFLKSYNGAESWVVSYDSLSFNRLKAIWGYSDIEMFGVKDDLYLLRGSHFYRSKNDGMEWELFGRFRYARDLFEQGDTLVFLGGGTTRSFDGGVSWELITEDDEFPTHINDFYSKVGDAFIAMAPESGMIHRSFDYGWTWDTLFTNDLFEYMVGDGEYLYWLNSEGVFRSEDLGENIMSFNAGLQNEGDFEVLLGNGEFVLIGKGGAVWRIEDDTWTLLEEGIELEEESHAYLLFNLRGDSDTIIYAGQNPGTDEGLYFYSLNDGASWTEFNGTEIEDGFDYTSFLYKGHIYTYANDAGGFNDFERIWKIDVDFISGLVSATQNEKLELSPNPASQLITIKVPSEVKSGTVLVIDMSGQIILEEDLKYSDTYIHLNLINLKSGAYLISIIDDDRGEVYSDKVIVTN